jgi:hypothetical protein
MTPPRRNPVYDLLSFLVGEKYKESLNKPTLVAPEPLARLTGEPSKAITQFGERLSRLEQEPGLLSERPSRRSSIASIPESVISLVSEAPSPRVEAPVEAPVAVPAQASIQSFFGGAAAPKVEAPVEAPLAAVRTREELKALMKQRKAAKAALPKSNTPLGNILETLQTIPEQDAGFESNVEFQ